MVDIKGANGNWIRARALLDSGSQSNFITHDLFKMLHLNSYKVDVPVSGINNAIEQISRGVST